MNRASALPGSDVATTRSPKILVIDDDRHVRTLLCDLLEAWGYEPDAAVDGREGLRLFEPGLTWRATPLLLLAPPAEP